LALLLRSFVPALTHGNKVHLRGTIEKISAESLLVKNAGWKVRGSESCRFDSLRLTHHQQDRTIEDLNADKTREADGSRRRNMVVIHATAKDNGLEADEIKFSPRGQARSGRPAKRALENSVAIALLPLITRWQSGFSTPTKRGTWG